jgi:predicted transcriptional regulator
MNTDKFLRVIDKPGLRRDVQTGAIINTQAADHDKYIQQRKVLMQQKQHTDQLENKVLEIESDVKDIKQLLKQVLEKL